MYLMVIHIPVFVRGGKTFTDISWQRDLLLARDWLAPSFGQLTVLCPSLPFEAMGDDLMQVVPVGDGDGIRVVPSFDLGCRAREFWRVSRHQWMSDVRRETKSAKVMHCSAGEVFRPMWYMAHAEGVRAGVTTVLVGPDMDPHLVNARNLKGRSESLVFDYLMNRSVRRSDLVLLKEGAVNDRYSNNLQNVRSFCHSMHREADVISESQLDARLARLGDKRPLQAVYAGRFIARKGLLDSIDAIGAARKRGVTVDYHLFGSGPEEAAMRSRGAELGVSDLLHFHGFVEYSREFISRLSEYDLLLFTPTEEDTPRMLYDAMAAGLPMVGTRIPFLEYRVKADSMGVLVDIGNGDLAGEKLCELSADRMKLAALSRMALVGGRRHTIEQWYRRRAEWTVHAASTRLTVPDRASVVETNVLV